MSPAPGWYPDPNEPDSLRWFDGSVWTGDQAPAPRPAADGDPSPFALPGTRQTPLSHSGANQPTLGHPGTNQPTLGYPGTNQPTLGYPGTNPAPRGYPGAVGQLDPALPAPWVGQPWQPVPPRRRSTGATVAIVLGSIVGGIVILGILAAIAIPVFLEHNKSLGLLAYADLTCEDVAVDAVAMSKEDAGAKGIPLVTITDTTMTADLRDGLTVPEGTDETLMLTCAGTGTWQDGVQTPVTVDVYIDRKLTELLDVRWDESGL